MTAGFSHNGEDLRLNQLFADIDDGFYVDVGACIPEKSSNTCLLYRKGWRGLVIDPMLGHPRLAAQWEAVRPEDQRLALAAGADKGEIDFWICNAVQFSTGAPATIAYWTEGADAAKVGTPNLKVPMDTLDHILAEHCNDFGGIIQFLNVDVEGMEGEVIAGLNLNLYRPWLMVIEAALPGKSTTSVQPWQEKVLDHGYRFLHDDGSNRWYAAAEHWRYFTQGAEPWPP